MSWLSGEEYAVASVLSTARGNTADMLRILADLRCVTAKKRCQLTADDPGGLGNPENRIVSAAMRNEKTGRIALCVRHRDELFRGGLLPGESPRDFDDGFVDARRQFLTREEAWPVALGAGQIIRYCGGGNPDTGVLYSENIY
jgi:hypothetical protein